MTQGILNPVRFLPCPLLPAEIKFARCLGEGKLCVVGNRELPRVPIVHGDSANVVRPEVIRFFAYGGDEKHLIRGSVIGLQGAWICGKHPLFLPHANIPYALMFFHCHFAVEVEMLHAKCAALYLNGSRLTLGLKADGLKTEGHVNLCAGFSAKHEVRLPGASIGGDLNCEGGKFHNPKGCALSADRLTSKGGVFLRRGFSAEGGVRLLGANIGGNLDCVGGEFRSPTGHALDAQNAKIGGGLIWRKMSGNGVVYLGYAAASVLADDLDSWKPFKVILDGFTYQFIGPTGAESRIEWLDKRPARMPFSPLPYEQAAKVLFGMGHANDAREILLEKERLQTKDKRTSWHHKIGRGLWDVFAGYGYRLRYTLGWMALFIYAGTSVFLDADLQHRIVPRQSVVLTHPDYQSAVRDGARPTKFVPDRFSGHPEFNQFWYSVDIFVPLFDLGQETHWHPARDERGGFSWVTLWYWLEIGFGWILTSLFLLSVTGVLRPRQSSGEKG